MGRRDRDSESDAHGAYERGQECSVQSEWHDICNRSYDSTVRLWDSATGALEATLTGHTSRIGSVLFSPDGTLVSGGWSYDGKVHVWNVGMGALKATLTVEDYGIRNLSFSPDGKTLAGSSNKTVFLWDIETSVVKLTLTGHT